MSEFDDMIPLNMGKPDRLEEYLNSNDEGSVNKLNIIHLFGKEKLEMIQHSLSKATGLAFITVDFRGEPITVPTYFSSFCRKVRNHPDAIQRCKSSDAFGSIQAAVTQKTNVYYCPCGLLEVAIPIVVRGHYLGGFIGGQIRCCDAPESVSQLASVMHSAKANEVVAQNKELMEEIPVYSYEKFLDIANLVFLVINQLSENQINQYMQEDVLKKQIKRIQLVNQRYMKENNQKTREVQELKSRSNPYEMLDVLVSLLNLTVIEEAPRTNELLSAFIEYARYKFQEKGTFVPITGELEQAERYLSFQQKKLGDRLIYSIQVPKEMHLQRIPSDILLPFVQNALYNGIMLKKEGGKITVAGTTRNGNLVLEISDNGPGLSEADLAIKYEIYKDKHEGYYIKLGMDYAKDRMRQLFGEGYDITVENFRNKGCKSTLVWPEHYEERTE